MAKKRKKRKARISNATDRHHVLFFRRDWSEEIQAELRRYFLFSMPIWLHRELHDNCENVPVLNDKEAFDLWLALQGIEHDMTLRQAYKWLIRNAPNEDFRRAIQQQYEFIRQRKGWQ